MDLEYLKLAIEKEDASGRVWLEANPDANHGTIYVLPKKTGQRVPIGKIIVANDKAVFHKQEDIEGGVFRKDFAFTMNNYVFWHCHELVYHTKWGNFCITRDKVKECLDCDKCYLSVHDRGTVDGKIIIPLNEWDVVAKNPAEQKVIDAMGAGWYWIFRDVLRTKSFYREFVNRHNEGSPVNLRPFNALLGVEPKQIKKVFVSGAGSRSWRWNDRTSTLYLAADVGNSYVIGECIEIIIELVRKYRGTKVSVADAAKELINA